MVLEVGIITVTPGAENDFSTAYRGAREYLVSTPGCHSVRMTRGVESPSQFTLLVEWDSVEAQSYSAVTASTRFPSGSRTDATYSPSW